MPSVPTAGKDKKDSEFEYLIPLGELRHLFPNRIRKARPLAEVLLLAAPQQTHRFRAEAAIERDVARVAGK
jgi:hypothetical protein